MEKYFIPTPDGLFAAQFSERGLARLEFPEAGTPQRREEPRPARQTQDTQWLVLTCNALDEALHGLRPKTLPPLDLTGGTEFQRKVWALLSSIAPGQTLSYAQVAEAIRRPKAARAVGQACGANPIPVLIPCHRVLAANYRLGGFSSDLNWKLKLLEREGIRTDGRDRSKTLKSCSGRQ